MYFNLQYKRSLIVFHNRGASASAGASFKIYNMRNNTVYYASPISEFKGENQVFKNIALNIAKFVYFNIRVTLISGGAKIEKYNGREAMDKHIIQAINRLQLSGFVVEGNTATRYKEEEYKEEEIIQKEDAVISSEDVAAIEEKPKKKKSQDKDVYDA